MHIDKVKERLSELARISEEGARLHPSDEEMFLTDKEALETAFQELDRLQEENDLAKKALIANSYEADERNNLLAEVQRLKKENEKLKEIDLTTVHIKGVCDEKEKWRNKIREKIKEIYEDKFNKYYDMFLEKRDIEKTISILKDLLKEE